MKQAQVIFQYDPEQIEEKEVRSRLESLSVSDGITIASVNVDGKGGVGADINTDAQDGHYNFNFDGPAEHLKDNNSTYNWKEDPNTNLGDQDAFNGEGDHPKVLFGEEAVEAIEESNEARKEESEEVQKVEELSPTPDEQKKETEKKANNAANKKDSKK